MLLEDNFLWQGVAAGLLCPVLAQVVVLQSLLCPGTQKAWPRSPPWHVSIVGWAQAGAEGKLVESSLSLPQLSF